MSTAAYVDGMLVDWGASLFNQRKVSATAPKRGMTGLVVNRSIKKNSVGHTGSRVSAKEIRSKLGSIVKKSPQVVVRISGGGTGMKHIKAHLDYITREGQIEAEDQEGNRLNGKDELDDLRDEWQYGGFRIPEESEKRNAFNIILSMPAGTDEIALKRAVRDFAKEEFGNYQYVMALHTFNTDPDPEPSPNPHVHLCVKARSLDGTRLNPRKEDLQRWREGFAEALRDHGVEASAVKRVQRNLRTQSPKATRYLNTEHQFKKTNREASKIERTPVDLKRVEKARQTEAKVLRSYREIAKALATSEDVEDRKLAVGIVDLLNETQPQQRNRNEQRSKGMDTER